MRRVLASLSLAALLAAAAAGQDDGTQQSVERFRLYNACRPMGLMVEELTDGAAEIGLTEEALQAARLYTEVFTEDYHAKADFAYLYVNVNVVGTAFSVSVEYHKRVSDRFGQEGIPGTWRSSFTGTTRTAGYIVSALSQHLDRFLAAYLRANEEACGSPAP